MKTDLLEPIRVAIKGFHADPACSDSLNPPPRKRGRSLRAASVLIPLVVRGEKLNVIMIQRSIHLKDHAGQIGLPGGKVEELDGGSLPAALREAKEEIGLERHSLEILGQCPDYETSTGFLITPFAAAVIADFTAKAISTEVEEVFEVPFNILSNPDNYRIETRIWQGRQRRYYAIGYGPRLIWGATAAILNGLAKRLARQCA